MAGLRITAFAGGKVKSTITTAITKTVMLAKSGTGIFGAGILTGEVEMDIKQSDWLKYRRQATPEERAADLAKQVERLRVSLDEELVRAENLQNQVDSLLAIISHSGG